MEPKVRTNSFRLWPTVVVLTVAGLALRIAAARGGLWTDEAWSMIYAQKARDPLGVFLRINHDNNHHIISLWMQVVGVHASPMVIRAPAIVAGALTIPAAALLFARRSAAAAIGAAFLFATSPIMVTYGSEARGYAPMILATLLMLWLAIGSVEDGARLTTRWWIALTATIGMLSNLTMLAPMALVTVWIYWEKRASVGSTRAIPATLAIVGPAIGACVLVLALVLGAAFASPTGLQLGGYIPFSFGDYSVALSNLTAWTLGLTFSFRWLAILALAGIGTAIIVRPPVSMGSRARLYGLLILGVPLVIGVERFGNALFSRYYLCTAIGLLLMASDWIGEALAKPGPQRLLCGAACALFLITAAWHDAQIIELKRGEPDRAVRIMAEEAPYGTRIAIGTEKLLAPMMTAAQRTNYPLVQAVRCAPAEYMISVREVSTTPVVSYCGRMMNAIAWSETTDLTGDAWVLYREDLQRRGAPVSGPRLARDTRISGRAGVAQG